MILKNAKAFYNRGIAPFYGILRLIGLTALVAGAAGSWGAPGKPDARFLRTQVESLPLTAEAKAAALARFPDKPEDRVTVEDVIQLRAYLWFDGPSRPHETWRNFLFSEGLRFGMTRADITSYIALEKSERVTGDSNIEILKLHVVSERLLIEMGIDQIKDAEFLEEEEINANPKLNDFARAEIIRAFRRAGFPLKFREASVAEPRNAGEDADAEETVAPAPAVVQKPRLKKPYDQVEEDWREMRFSDGLRTILRNAGIVKREDLAAYTKVELFGFPGISRDQVYRIDGQLRMVGITIYLDAIERATKLHAPIDLTTPINGHIQIDRTPGENRKAVEALAALGIYSVGDLMNADRRKLPVTVSIQILLRRVDEMLTATCVTALGKNR